MNKKNSLSAVISVFNGEKELNDCLKSISFADEIIVVNNSSTDRTLDIAKQYTNKIFTKPNNPMLNINKNFGFSKTKGKWILYLDVDERVSEELREEIIHTIRNDSVMGYFLPRKNIIFGKWMEHTGWYPDYQLRLFQKGFGKFEEKHVHEMVSVTGKVGYLKGNLIHYNYSTISQFLQKLQLYASNEAENLIEEGYKFTWHDAISFPVKEFLSRFFARGGYKDGFHGLMLSIFMAFYHFVVFACLWEKMGFERIDKNLIVGTAIEFKKSYKEFSFWINNEKLKTIENPFKKVAYKILRKIRGA
ncbi:MAG: glycosyltransferase family 2 protein [Candidatus Levybacteria bacterium]|nr:glycosyltransferase family 2 protein [Candidatus Levybacteria bacterium]